MKECKRLKCPKNKGLQGFVRVRKRAKAVPDDAKHNLKNPVFMRVCRHSLQANDIKKTSNSQP